MRTLSIPFKLSPSGRLWKFVACCLPVLIVGCGGGRNGGGTSGARTTSPPPVTAPLQHNLFVGDSFTHGRYTPVRPYNSGGTQNATAGSPVVDENFGATGKPAEILEPGPYNGIPGIFAEFAVEAGLNYDVHIEAISETSLAVNFADASSVIEQSKWNAVVLQELSVKPIPARSR